MKDQLEALVLMMYEGGIHYREAVEEFKKSFVTIALRENRGNVSKTAPKLGVHRNTLNRILIDLEMDVGTFRVRRRPPSRASSANSARKASG